jgi:hypothetical protein
VEGDNIEHEAWFPLLLGVNNYKVEDNSEYSGIFTTISTWLLIDILLVWYPVLMGMLETKIKFRELYYKVF